MNNANGQLFLWPYEEEMISVDLDGLQHKYLPGMECQSDPDGTDGE